MSSNLITIDDEDLIEELRRYGEKNLPSLPSSSTATTSSRKKASQFNNQNREILVKKLNHYKAKEKAQANSNKYLQRQSNGKNNNSVESINSQKTIIKNEQDDDDIIELSETSEYVQVSNAFTSPLSISSSEPSNNRPISYATTNVVSPLYSNRLSSNLTASNKITSPLQNKDLNFISLRDKLELDKTLSKYRSEINEIISGSIVKNRKTDAVLNKYLNNVDNSKDKDIVYEGTYTSNFIQTTQPDLRNEDQNKKSGFFNSFNFFKKQNIPNSVQSCENNDKLFLRQKRNNLKMDLNNKHSAFLTPGKENTSSNFYSHFMMTFFRLVSSIGLQVSKILPYLVMIIFTVIVLQYTRMKIFTNPSQSIIKTDNNNYKNNNIDKKIEHQYCDEIKNDDCFQTKLMVRDLIDYLRYKSGLIDCNIQTDTEAQALSHRPDYSIDFDKSVHITKISKYLSEEKGLITDEMFKSVAMTSMLSAINKNPQWQLRLLNSTHGDTNDISQVTYILSSVSSKSMLCRIRELLHFLYVRLIMITSIIIFIFLLWLIYKTYSNNRTEKDKAFFQLVSKVTNLVENNYEMSLLDPTNIKPFIAISHIHDTLFDPSIRASNKKLWNKVVKFIQDHESRIHLSTEFIDGEETHVWKWVVPKHINSLSPKNSNKTPTEGIGLANSTMIHHNFPINNGVNQTKEIDFNLNRALNGSKENINNKMTISCENQSGSSNNGWQGDAFNRSDKLIHSPTPCLKIRNMFDPTEITTDQLLAIKIHNDILNKFSTNAKFNENHLKSSILHISCDKKSKEGCVYVKCSNNETAGQVYQSLNGTWYNGKLLNVKFLRSDRYLERFPESINFINPLQPIQI